MHVYLPIAGMSVNALLMLGVGAAVGYLSGLFGVGGGFLLTPLLMVLGVPPAVAVSTGAAHICASSVSGALAQQRRNNVDARLGIVLTAGGAIGAVIGVGLVGTLRAIGQFELFVSLCYVLLLGAIGSLMLIESAAALRRPVQRATTVRAPRQHVWLQHLPLRMRFNRSKLYMSAIPAVIIGAFVGLLTAIMGVGGGFVLVPAMIYLLRIPTNVAVGTSLFQIMFVSAATALLHAAQNTTVDVVLAILLMVGGVIGAQLGVTAGEKFRAEQMRFLLAIIVLMVCARVAFDLAIPPEDLYSIEPLTAR